MSPFFWDSVVRWYTYIVDVIHTCKLRCRMTVCQCCQCSRTVAFNVIFRNRNVQQALRHVISVALTHRSQHAQFALLSHVSVGAARCWRSQWRHRRPVRGIIHLANGPPAVITAARCDSTPLPVSIATIQLLSVGSSATVRLSALGWIRLWSPVTPHSEPSQSIRPTGTGRNGQAGSPVQPQDGIAGAKTIPHRQRVWLWRVLQAGLHGEQSGYAACARQTHDKIARRWRHTA